MVTYGYWEITRDGRRWIAPGDIVIRKAHEFHRIELEPGTHPLTIFWHGPKINDWGFLGADGVKLPANQFLASSEAYLLSNRYIPNRSEDFNPEYNYDTNRRERFCNSWRRM